MSLDGWPAHYVQHVYHAVKEHLRIGLEKGYFGDRSPAKLQLEEIREKAKAAFYEHEFRQIRQRQTEQAEALAGGQKRQMIPNPHSSPLDSEFTTDHGTESWTEGHPESPDPTWPGGVTRKIDPFRDRQKAEAAALDPKNENPRRTPIDRIPNLEFDKEGRKTFDSSATAAVMGLQPSEAAGKASALENLYQQWRFPDKPKKREARDEIAEAARKPLMILRQMIVELARALQESTARENAAMIQASFTKDYLKLCDDQVKLRDFLFVNFEGELAQATSLNKPLLQLVKELLMRGRPQ